MLLLHKFVGSLLTLLELNLLKRHSRLLTLCLGLVSDHDLIEVLLQLLAILLLILLTALKLLLGLGHLDQVVVDRRLLRR